MMYVVQEVEKHRDRMTCDMFGPYETFDEAAESAKALASRPDGGRTYGHIFDYVVHELLAVAPTKEDKLIVGWKKMTEEVRNIQQRHLDHHQGDVYHAMQYIAVKFGFKDKGPWFVPKG